MSFSALSWIPWGSGWSKLDLQVVKIISWKVVKALRWDLPRKVQSVLQFCHVFIYSENPVTLFNHRIIIGKPRSHSWDTKVTRAPGFGTSVDTSCLGSQGQYDVPRTSRQAVRPSYISKRPCARSSWCGLMKSSFSRLSACILGQHKLWRSASCFKAPRQCFCIDRVLIAKIVSIHYLKYWTYHIIAETWFRFLSIFYTSHIDDEFSAR